MIGTVIGSYKITDKIGEGGMGSVFKGIDEMLEREVAIKMLRPELARQPEVVERFRTEAVTLAKLNHPNIATLYSFVRQGEDFFMVMEFVRGNTLETVLRNFGAIPYERAVPLFCQALEGIDHAHKQGIIHRDIKPANAMVLDTGSVKVMDFGIARMLGSARMTRQGNVVGTVEYMSPEQIKGEESDARSDIYSLGILLYEMLTGRVPFSSTSEYELMKQQVEEAPPPPTQFASQIPLLIEQAIMRALAKKPEARFKTAGEFRSVLLGTLRTLTGQLGNTTANYSAPATRYDQEGLKGTAVAGVVRSSVEVRQGQVGGTRPEVTAQNLSAQVPAAPSGGTQAFVSQPNSREVVAPPVSKEIPKETNERQTERFQPQPWAASTQVIQASPQTAAPGTQVIQPSPQIAAPGQSRQVPPPTIEQASFFSRLNWKHYAAAAVLVIALISVPVALTLRKNAAPPPPPAESQEQPVAEEQQPTSQPAAEPEAQPETGESVLTEADSANANTADANKAARSKRTDKNANAAAETGQETTPTDTAQTPPAQPPQPAQTTEQPAATTDSKPAVAKEGEKTAEPAKKEEKKKGGIGGFFKKVFGGDKKDDKKDDKKKDAKKPNS